jgi:hypothetical protein
MFRQVREVFKSNIKALEILCVLNGVKPAARIMVKEEEKERICSFFEANKLFYAAADFKISKQDREKGYSDKAVKVGIGERGYYIFYVSKDKEMACKAKEAEGRGEHKELGKLLGYPECCCEFFERYFPEESKRDNDFTMTCLKNSNGFSFPFHTNIAARHFDLALIFHFPCSFNCKDSIELAKKHLFVLEEDDKEAAGMIKGMLRGGVIYSSSGVFLLRYPELEGNRLHYDGIMGTAKNEMAFLFKNAEYIQIHNKSLIEVGGLEIKNIGVMLFS